MFSFTNIMNQNISAKGRGGKKLDWCPLVQWKWTIDANLKKNAIPKGSKQSIYKNKKEHKTYLWKDEQFLLGKLLTFGKVLLKLRFTLLLFVKKRTKKSFSWFLWKRDFLWCEKHKEYVNFKHMSCIDSKSINIS